MSKHGQLTLSYSPNAPRVTYIDANAATERVQLEERAEQVNKKIKEISARQNKLQAKAQEKQTKKPNRSFF